MENFYTPQNGLKLEENLQNAPKKKDGEIEKTDIDEIRQALNFAECYEYLCTPEKQEINTPEKQEISAPEYEDISTPKHQGIIFEKPNAPKIQSTQKLKTDPLDKLNSTPTGTWGNTVIKDTNRILIRTNVPTTTVKRALQLEALQNIGKSIFLNKTILKQTDKCVCEYGLFHT